MHQETEAFLEAWEQFHELPPYPRVGLRIPPEEQFFKDLYYGIGSWSTRDIKSLIEEMGYEPSTTEHLNHDFVKDKIVEIFDAMDLGGGAWLVDKELVEEIFAE